MTVQPPSATSGPANGTTNGMAKEKETILVVDDEASIRRILETRLSMIGYHVVTACDGLEALDAFRSHQPDLVVLDVMMPRLDG
jgi:OmpR family response regulator RpaB